MGHIEVRIFRAEGALHIPFLGYASFNQITLNDGILCFFSSGEVFSSRLGTSFIHKQSFSFVNSLQKYPK